MSANAITLTLGGSLELLLRPAPPPGYTVITLAHQGLRFTAKGDHMAYTLPADHYVEVRVDYVDAAGNPARVDGAVAWSAEPDGVVQLDVDADDTQVCTITPVGDAGNVQITATADADLGAGVTNLVTLMDVTVVAGQAVAGTISPVGEALPITP